MDVDLSVYDDLCFWDEDENSGDLYKTKLNPRTDGVALTITKKNNVVVRFVRAGMHGGVIQRELFYGLKNKFDIKNLPKNLRFILKNEKDCEEAAFWWKEWARKRNLSFISHTKRR